MNSLLCVGIYYICMFFCFFFEFVIGIGIICESHSDVFVVVCYVCIIHYGDILWDIIQILIVCKYVSFICLLCVSLYGYLVKQTSYQGLCAVMSAD